MKRSYLPKFVIWVVSIFSVGLVQANELLVNEEGTSSSFLPLLIGAADRQRTEVQTMYLADQLTDISIGGTIHEMTFYPISYQRCDTIGSICTIRLFELDSAFNRTLADTTGANVVYEGSLPYCNQEMPITFTTPYTYHGGNLVIDFHVKTPSTKGIQFTNFKGANRASVGYMKYWNGSSWSIESQSIQPTVLFIYTPAVDFCSRPEKIRITDVTHTDAVISWTAGNSEEIWEVKVDSIVETVSNPSYTLTQLTPGTTYTKTFAIRSICGAGDTSAVRNSTFTFNTDCYDATIPYMEDFESVTPKVLPPCWTLSSNSRIEGNAASKYLFLDGTNSAAYAITPRLSRPAKELIIFFSEQEHAQYGSWGPYGKCVLGTITDPSDISTFTPIDTLPDSRESYRKVEYYLQDAPMTDYYVIFYYYVNDPHQIMGMGSYCYIDSIQIDLLPTCFPVSNIRLDNVEATTAELTWAPGKDEHAWDIWVVDASGDTLFNNTVTENRCTITGLTHRTQYAISASVRANCGDGDVSSMTTAVLSFETPISCDSPIETLPFTENFESTNTAVKQMPSCWTKIVRNNSYSIYPYVYANSTYCHSCDHTLYIRGHNYGIYTILPEFSMDVNTLQISLWTRNSLVAPNHGSFIVGAMSNPNDSTTFFPIDTLPQSTNFTEHLVYLDRVPAGYKYIAISYDRFDSSSSSFEPTGMIDDITVDYAPACLTIEDITLNSVGPNNAVFSWTPMRENPYGFEVTVKNEYDNSIVLSDTVFSPAIHVTDLDFSSDYRLTVSVTTICQPGKISEPYEKTFFIQTECQAIDSLYRESFEHFVGYPYKTQSITTPSCWDVINANSPYFSQRIYVTNNASFVRKGKQSLLFQYSYDKPSYAIMPEMDVDLSTRQISFYYHLIGSYHPGKLIFGYFPKDSLMDSAFVVLEFLSNTTSWDSLKNYRLENVPNDVRLAFKYYTSDLPNGCNMTEAGIAIDDILIEDINNCHPPLRVWYDSLTSNSVQIHWDPEFENNTHFNVVIINSLNGKDTLFQAQNYPDTKCIINGLQFAKYYSLACHISTACDDRTSDILKSYVAFVTECAPFAIPYADNFDNESYPLMAGDIPFCWTQWGDERTGLLAWSHGELGITHSGEVILCLYTDSASWSLVALPEFEVSADSLSISFYSRIVSPNTNWTASLEVGYMPNPTDSSSFVPIATIPNYEQYTSTTVDFRRIPKDVHVIAFRFFGGSDVHKMYIDDIIVDYFYDESRSFKSTNDIHHPQTTKIIYNGKLYILRDGKVYTIFGTIVDNIVNSTL